MINNIAFVGACLIMYTLNMTDEEVRQILIQRRQRARKKRARRGITVLVLAGVIILGLVYALGHYLGGKKYDSEVASIVSVTEDVPLVNTAAGQIGNEGGEPFWTWFGFDSRVDWCAIFVSWCAEQCGYIDSGAVPSFAMVDGGAGWFESRDQWLDKNAVPDAGDLVFFDWEQDDSLDHVGIVATVIDDTLFTIEGNSSDRCRVKAYDLGDPVIYGFGHIKT